MILARDIGLTVRFKTNLNAEYDQWVSEGWANSLYHGSTYPELTAEHLQAVTKIVSSQGFIVLKRNAYLVV